MTATALPAQEIPVETLLSAAIEIARRAGREIMRHYRSDIAVERKSDLSPVTAADREAEAVIVQALRRFAPSIPVVAEEALSSGASVEVNGGRFWLVDPLDGTREFVAGRGEFTVNIGLVVDGAPILGVVHAPALDRLDAGAVGIGAFTELHGSRRPLKCKAADELRLTVVSSRSHGDAQALRELLADCHVAGERTAGSALKFCCVASGEADLYPRLGRTMQWDTAAGHALLRAAGGEVWSLADGRALVYGKAGFDNPHFIAAAVPPPSVLQRRFRLGGATV